MSAIDVGQIEIEGMEKNSMYLCYCSICGKLADIMK